MTTAAISPVNGWREPTTSVPLRFGSYRGRYSLALVLLFAGGATLLLTSAYTLPLAVFGLLASAAGWILMPAQGWRRAVAAAPALFGVVSLLGGAQAGVFTALALGAWLLVRERPLRSFVVLALPIAVALLLGQLFPQYGWGVLVASVMGLVLVASAWLARSLARTKARRNTRTGTDARPRART